MQARTSSEPAKLYVKLSFGYDSWSVPQTAGGLMAVMLAEPEILEELPKGVIPDQYSQRLMSLFGKQAVSAGFYHDCGNLSREHIEEALQQFQEHYHFFSDGLPAAAIGPKPNDNEIIVNLKTALENVTLQPSEQKPLLSVESCDTMEEFLSKQTF